MTALLTRTLPLDWEPASSTQWTSVALEESNPPAVSTDRAVAWRKAINALRTLLELQRIPGRSDTERSPSRHRQAGQEVPVDLISFRNLIRSLFVCPGAEKAALRREVIRQILEAGDPFGHVEELLNLCSREGGTDGLDLGIDVLARVGRLALDYAWQFLHRDVGRWEPLPQTAHHRNDDTWYVLLRSIGRAGLGETELLLLLLCCMAAGNRSIREAAVEGLRDLGTSRAEALLRLAAESDPDALVRETAQEALGDMES